MLLTSRICTKRRASRLGQLQRWKPHPYSSSTLRVQAPRYARDDQFNRCFRNSCNQPSVKTAAQVRSQDNFIDEPSFKPEGELVKSSSIAITAQDNLIDTSSFKPEEHLGQTSSVAITTQDKFVDTPSFNQEKHLAKSSSVAITVQNKSLDTSSIKPEEHLAKTSSVAITCHREDQTLEHLSFGSFGPSNTKLVALNGAGSFIDEFFPQHSESQKRKEKRRKDRAVGARKHKVHMHLQKRLVHEKDRTSYNWRTPLALLEQPSPTGYADSPMRVSYYSRRPQIWRQLRAELIPGPPVWSELTLYHYVQDLTQSSVDRFFRRQIYGKGRSHVARVSRILLEVFYAPAAREFLSPNAFNVAIFFFCIHTAVPQAAALFEYMDWLQMKISGQTMDMILQSAASNQDLSNFTRVLRRCIDRGIVPAPGVWVALVQAVRSKEAQEVIIQSMRKRNMLEDIGTVRRLVTYVVRRDIIKHLHDGLDPASFLDSIETRFGPGWLSTTAGNIILYELGQRKPAAEVVGMLHILMELGMNADETTLNTLLIFCSWEIDHLLAIRVLRLLHIEKGVRTGELTFDYLFIQAWRSRCYNLARVIWRTACIRGVASYRIQGYVARNLMFHRSKAPGNEPGSSACIWNESAGEVVVGIEPVPELDHLLSSNPVTEASSSKVRRQLIARDVATAGRYRLVDDLSELLTNALKLDRTWKECGAWKGKSSEWKRKMAIAVRVQECKDKITDNYDTYDERPLRRDRLDRRQMYFWKRLFSPKPRGSTTSSNISTPFSFARLSRIKKILVS